MKTQIVQLEAHDDLISVKDKMNWGQTQRILLVWPQEPVPGLSAELDLVLLHRHAIDLGSQLGLVTRSSDVRFNAARLKIPVFSNTREAHLARWRTRKRKRFPARFNLPGQGESTQPDYLFLQRDWIRPSSTWRDHAIVRLFAFLVGVTAVAILLSLILPSATLAVVPAQEEHTVNFKAFTDPEVIEVNPSGAVPSSVVSVVVEGRYGVQTTGTTTIGGDPAFGEVTFTNLTDRPIIIPKGAIVRTADTLPIRFMVQENIELEAGSGKQVTASLRAVTPGEEGNVSANRLTIVEGVLGLQLTVDNLRAASGGTNRQLSAPTTVDRERAYKDLLASLQQTASTEINARLAPEDFLLSSAPVLVEILEEEYSPSDDSPSDEVEVMLRAVFESQVIAYTDLESLARRVLEASTPAGYSLIPETQQLTLQTLPAASEGDGLSWEMQVSQRIEAVLLPNQISQDIIGQPVDEAIRTILDKYPIQGMPQLQLVPTWWPRFPYLPSRITIEVIQSTP